MTDEIRALLTDIVHYTRKVEEQIDGEWGMVRKWEELKKDGELPDFYDTVIAMLGGEPAERK